MLAACQRVHCCACHHCVQGDVALRRLTDETQRPSPTLASFASADGSATRYDIGLESLRTRVAEKLHGAPPLPSPSARADCGAVGDDVWLELSMLHFGHETQCLRPLAASFTSGHGSVAGNGAGDRFALPHTREQLHRLAPGPAGRQGGHRTSALLRPHLQPPAPQRCEDVPQLLRSGGWLREAQDEMQRLLVVVEVQEPAPAPCRAASACVARQRPVCSQVLQWSMPQVVFGRALPPWPIALCMRAGKVKGAADIVRAGSAAAGSVGMVLRRQACLHQVPKPLEDIQWAAPWLQLGRCRNAVVVRGRGGIRSTGVALHAADAAPRAKAGNRSREPPILRAAFNALGASAWQAGHAPRATRPLERIGAHGAGRNGQAEGGRPS
mmetsp:Transcript_75729/g.245102  ORF Transcript_75729/g.245102 Transcript_75729/m.245102 type:complete len:383 (+) Transcript_75729:1420-2568(+)